MAKKRIKNDLSDNFEFNSSLYDNEVTYIDFLRRMTKICLSIFEWENLPDSMNSRFLEESLFFYGSAALLYDENVGYVNTLCTSDGNLNMYRLPTRLNCYSPSNVYQSYRDVYNGLVKELTNPKYNLKVVEESNMIAGVDYSEYWKINQDEMYFITPTKISYLPISGDTASVIGNGMTIGLNGGDTLVESGLAFTGANATGLTARYSQLQQPAGTKLTDATQWVGSAGNSGHYGVGLSTDPNKSGIIADLTSAKSETAQLYFKVANAVQNIEAINVGEVLEALADKISRQDCPAYIVESYVNGTSWYVLYSNGWWMQGFRVADQAQSKQVAYTLLKTMRDTNYSAMFTENAGTGGCYQTKVFPTSTTQITVVTPSGGGMGGGFVEVRGYTL